MSKRLATGQFALSSSAQSGGALVSGIWCCEFSDTAFLHPLNNSLSTNVFLHLFDQGRAVRASIKSIEDHGYIIDVGVEDASAFMPTENATAYLKLVCRTSSVKIYPTATMFDQA